MGSARSLLAICHSIVWAIEDGRTNQAVPVLLSAPFPFPLPSRPGLLSSSPSSADGCRHSLSLALLIAVTPGRASTSLEPRHSPIVSPSLSLPVQRPAPAPADDSTRTRAAQGSVSTNATHNRAGTSRTGSTQAHPPLGRTVRLSIPTPTVSQPGTLTSPECVCAGASCPSRVSPPSALSNLHPSQRRVLQTRTRRSAPHVRTAANRATTSQPRGPSRNRPLPL